MEMKARSIIYCLLLQCLTYDRMLMAPLYVIFTLGRSSVTQIKSCINQADTRTLPVPGV